MNLIIDIGNTFIKISLFEKDREIFSQKLNDLSDEYLKNLKNTYSTIQKVIISSVKDRDVTDLIDLNFSHYLFLEYDTPLPIKINYDTPKTLGKDRIAAAVGAYSIFPHENVLIIDAGTAITFDFITNDGTYQGGNISPGLNTRFQALHQFTGKLPLVSPAEPFSSSGKSTKQAISSGVLFGMIYEIQGYVNHYQHRYDKIKIIFTGGDANFFMELLEKNIINSSNGKYFVEKLKSSIFVILNLNMIGLNRILQFYVTEN